SASGDHRELPSFPTRRSSDLWAARAAAYDAHREAERLAARGTEEIEQFRERQRKLAAATTATAVQMLTRLNERLATLRAEEITPQMIPSYARAVAAVAEASTNAEATANGVTALLKQLEGAGEWRAGHIAPDRRAAGRAAGPGRPRVRPRPGDGRRGGCAAGGRD